MVSGDSIEIDQTKIEAIVKRTAPRNAKYIHGWYRPTAQIHKKLCRNCKLIFKLLGKDQKFVWSNDCQKAFETLKEILISHLILRQPNFKLELCVHADASKYALGWHLSQIDPLNNEYNIEYGSRLLRDSEINYTVTEKECLSPVEGIKRLR